MREHSRMRNQVLETLWHNAVLGLAVYDAETGLLKDANTAFLELLDARFRTKKTLGTPLEQCLPDVELNGLRDVLQRAASSGLACQLENLTIRRGAMTTITASCCVLPMLDGLAEEFAAGGRLPGAAEAPAAGGEGGGKQPSRAPVTPTRIGLASLGAVRWLLLVASERKAELPVTDRIELIDTHTRHALARRFHLSARELDIVSECLRGKKNRQIALDLHIGISTVKRHLESAYRKLGISSSRSLPLSILQVIRETTVMPTETSPTQRSQAA